MIKISKIFGDFVPREFSVGQGLLQTSRHFENRRGEDPGDEVGMDKYANFFKMAAKNKVREIWVRQLPTNKMEYEGGTQSCKL